MLNWFKRIAAVFQETHQRLCDLEKSSRDFDVLTDEIEDRLNNIDRHVYSHGVSLGVICSRIRKLEAIIPKPSAITAAPKKKLVRKHAKP